LIGGAAAFFDPIDHLLGERRAHHAVATHSGDLQDIGIGKVFGFSLEAERIAHAVATDAGRVTALLGAID